MKTNILLEGAAFAASVITGVAAAPALLQAGLTLSGAFGALVVVMLGFQIAQELNP